MINQKHPRFSERLCCSSLKSLQVVVFVFNIVINGILISQCTVAPLLVQVDQNERFPSFEMFCDKQKPACLTFLYASEKKYDSSESSFNWCLHKLWHRSCFSCEVDVMLPECFLLISFIYIKRQIVSMYHPLGKTKAKHSLKTKTNKG